MMDYSDRFLLKGRYIICGWRAGELPRLMRSGLSLPDAMRAARPLWTHAIDNMIVDAGLALAAQVLIDAESTGLTWHAIGTNATAPAAGDTALGTEVKRLAFTSRERTAAVLTLTAFYLASECTYHIRELGIWGGAAASSAPGSGTLFSRALYDVDNSAGLNDETFSYELTLMRG